MDRLNFIIRPFVPQQPRPSIRDIFPLLASDRDPLGARRFIETINDRDSVFCGCVCGGLFGWEPVGPAASFGCDRSVVEAVEVR